jgi:KDO2-lipid IV(A) lauroyltransferase
MKRIGFYLFIVESWILSKLPKFILYFIADIVFFVLYYIIKYRRKTVAENLRNSFPEKSDQELKSIEKKFYHHLSDIFVENAALIKMSKKRIQSFIKIEDSDLVKDLYNANKNVIGVTGHYGNWEIYFTLPLVIKQTVLGVYKPLNNDFFDVQFLKMRSKFGAVPVTMNDSFKTVISYYRNNQLFFLGLVADQRPPKKGGHYWTRFLNQETAIFLGPEKIAKKLNTSLVFVYQQKIKRGEYLIKFTPLYEDVSKTNEFEITETHVRFLEKLIQENPEYWLWSHRRWKHKKKEA